MPGGSSPGGGVRLSGVPDCWLGSFDTVPVGSPSPGDVPGGSLVLVSPMERSARCTARCQRSRAHLVVLSPLACSVECPTARLAPSSTNCSTARAATRVAVCPATRLECPALSRSAACPAAHMPAPPMARSAACPAVRMAASSTARLATCSVVLTAASPTARRAASRAAQARLRLHHWCATLACQCRRHQLVSPRWQQSQFLDSRTQVTAVIAAWP